MIGFGKMDSRFTSCEMRNSLMRSNFCNRCKVSRGPEINNTLDVGKLRNCFKLSKRDLKSLMGLSLKTESKVLNNEVGGE